LLAAQPEAVTHTAGRFACVEVKATRTVERESEGAAIEPPSTVPQLLANANPTAQPPGRIEIVLADGTACGSSMNWPCAVCWRYCADDQLAIRCTRVAGLRPDRYAQELAPAKAGGMDGLAMLAQQVLAEDPFDGALFVFRGKRGGLVKLLWYDGQGRPRAYAAFGHGPSDLFSKRLETGHFVWPVTETGRVSLTPAQLSMPLEGIDWRMPLRVRRPELAG
jgi:transposase